MADGYLVITNINFTRGNPQIITDAPEQPKFTIQISYTIYTDSTKTEAMSGGACGIPWDDALDTSNAFNYAYTNLKTLPKFSNSIDC